MFQDFFLEGLLIDFNAHFVEKGISLRFEEPREFFSLLNALGCYQKHCLAVIGTEARIIAFNTPDFRVALLF